MKKPTTHAIRKARAGAEMSRAQAALVVGSSPRTWEAWEQGLRNMPAGKFDLFLMKTNQKHPPEIVQRAMEQLERRRAAE